MEGAAQLDLQSLIDAKSSNQLNPIVNKTPFYMRFPDRFIIFPYVIAAWIIIARSINDRRFELYEYISLILFLILFNQKIKIRKVVTVDERGMLIPYTWLTRKLISWDSILEINYEELTVRETGDLRKGIRIQLDTTLLRYNVSGLEIPTLLLTNEDYNEKDLELFYEKLVEVQRKAITTNNTLAQRLTDQVIRSWKGRYKLIGLNLLDSTTEAIFYLFLLEFFALGIFRTSIWKPFGYILILLYLFVLLIFYLLDKPSAIIGFRPHELGPLIYNEEDVITTVRFIVMSRPHEIRWVHCELLFPDNDRPMQISELKQFYPKEIEQGELKYCVAQFLGNQTKAIGAKIHFEYIGQETQEVIYQVDITWG